MKDQEAEKCIYICLVQAVKTCALQPEPALEIFGILMQHIKTELIREFPSAGPRIGLWSPLQFLWEKDMEACGENPKPTSRGLTVTIP